MSNNKKSNHTNEFKFVLYLKGEQVASRIFSADQFNPVTRYSVDIRSILPTVNYRLQKVLSLKHPKTIGNYGDTSYNFVDFYRESANALSKRGRIPNKLVSPEYSFQTINNKKLKGVEFKYGFYINTNPIVERDFFVDGYNPEVRFSLDLSETISDICDEIYHKIRRDDINNMWDDYYLINTFNVNSQQLRDMDNEEREILLKKLNKKRRK